MSKLFHVLSMAPRIIVELKDTCALSIYNQCCVFFVCPGSPFLASEDRVLGGVIVLRCCRCVEAPPPQSIQGILGKRRIVPGLITLGGYSRHEI